jgi:integrase
LPQFRATVKQTMATIRRRGELQWEVQIRRNGFPRQNKTFITRAEAQAWANMIESEMSRGVWLSRGEAESTTLTDALTRYEREVTPRKRSATDELPKLRVLARTDIAKRTLASVRSADIAALRDEWLADGWAPATVVRLLALLSHVFSTARREWGMESLSNPVELVTKPRVANARTRRIIGTDPVPDDDDNDSRSRELAGGEIERIIAATRSSLLPPLIHLALETGMRRGELCRLRWQHVDLTSRVAHLPSEVCKNGEARDVPLSPLAVDVLRSLRRVERIDGRVFTIADPHAVTRAFSRAVARARATYERKCAAAGKRPNPQYLKDLRWHDLRHEATSRLAAHFQMHELAKITGHKTPQMLLRYYHPNAAELAKKLG